MELEMIRFSEATPVQLAALIRALDDTEFTTYYLDKYLRWVEAGTRLPIQNNVNYWESR